MVTGMRHGGQMTYRITVPRLPSNKADWKELAVDVKKNGTHFAQITIPEGKVGTYFTTAFAEDRLTFEAEAQNMPNLLPGNDYLVEPWACYNYSTKLTTPCINQLSRTSGVADPTGNQGAWKTIANWIWLTTDAPIQVKASTWYTLSAYVYITGHRNISFGFVTSQHFYTTKQNPSSLGQSLTRRNEGREGES